MFEAIKKMTDEIVRILNDRVYGVWLYGSVVLDDFQLGWSDIDFIALTDSIISSKQAESLLMLRQDMLHKEPDNPYYRSFEGIIANISEYRNQSFTRLVYWGTSGQRVTDRYCPDTFSRFELARYSKSVYGIKPWILPPPGREDLTEAIRKHCESIRKYAVQTDGSLYSCGWLLDIARCIYTLQFGDVISKTQAGIWALEEHIFPDEDAMRKTLAIRQHPLDHQNRNDVKQWLKGLGPIVQKYADVLEQELKISEIRYQ